MFNELNSQLSVIKDNIRKRDKIQYMMEKTNKSLNEEIRKKLELKNILDKEEMDVKKLQSLSISGVFYAVLGSKDEKLSKERQEYLAAKLKYDECCNHVKYLDEEIKSYKEKLKEYYLLDKEYEQIVKKKQKLILEANDDNTKKLLELVEKITDNKSNLNEINEALDAGNRVSSQLNKTAKSLNSAKNWGTYDMLGGGLLATAAKHSKIDEAKDYASDAHAMLSKFKRELEDVRIESNLEINIDSFDRFVDYFFDGLIADWSVQSKINNSLSNVNTAINNVDAIVAKLNKVKGEIEKKISEDNVSMDSLIETVE
ncbi:hypothetical protein SH2C18_50880 [Clostridium sediminicola]|uniref:hypothetical protein n=1 Tax=Clostridium sediminicola TaxID=3114879 RepID=UPI0031F1CA79